MRSLIQRTLVLTAILLTQFLGWVPVEAKKTNLVTQPFTLLVIKREHCPHCEQWQNDVYNHWQELGLENNIPKSHIRILDAENDDDMKSLIDLINTGKIKEEIHFVPTFIVLNSNNEEIPSCRVSGYKNIAGFKRDIQRSLSHYKKP